MVYTLLSLDDFLGMECTPNMSRLDYLLAVSEVSCLKSMYGEEDNLIAEQDEEFCMKKDERITQNIRSILSSFPQVLDHRQEKYSVLDCDIPKEKRSRPKSMIKKAVENNTEKREEHRVVKVDNGEKNRRIKIHWCAAGFVKPIGVNNQEFLENRVKVVGDTENRVFKINIRKRSLEVANDDFSNQERFVKKKLAKKSEGTRGKKRIEAAAPPVVIISRELSIEFKNQITFIGGSLESAKLVIEKTLFETDVKAAEGRLSIPQKKMSNRFLNAEEEELLNMRNGGKMCEMNVTLIEPSRQIGKINLRKWTMNKDNGNASTSYVLVTYWNDVTRRNGLRSGMKMQLWAFRKGEKLCFALVNV